MTFRKLSILFGLFVAGNAFADPIIIGHARFTVLSSEAIRMEYSPTNQFVDDYSLFATNRDAELTAEEQKDLKVSTSNGTLTIDTGRVIFTYVDDGQPFHTGNPSAQIQTSTRAHHHGNPSFNPPFNPKKRKTFSTWTFGQASTGNLGGTRNGLDHIDLESAPAPVSEGLISRDGWYYLDDSQRLLVSGATFESGWVKLRDPKTDTMDGYFFGYGLDYKSALQSLTRVSGSVPMPRRYTLGAWYSRWWPYSSDDYRTIVQEFHQHDFPIDMLVMDMDWHRQKDYTGLSWNRQLLPDAENFLKDMHTEGLHVTLNDHPQGGIAPDEDTYVQFMQAMGEDPASHKTLMYDAGNMKYIENVLHIAHTPLEKEGVDFWWLDWLGDMNSPYNKIGWMNELYFRHSQDSIPEKNLRGQSFSRWADWGDQRHPIHFSGDAYIEWANLQYEVPFTANSGNVGCFFWSHDIGGFILKDLSLPRLDGELVGRWAQFGAVSAVLRLHSANKSYLDKRPWKFSSEIETSMKNSFHLRSEIFPYIYSSAWQSHTTSVPLIRPLYIEFPEVQEAYVNAQEYLFGDALLAAPIVSKSKDPEDDESHHHKSSQKVWFPEGRWFDWFTGEEHQAGTSFDSTHDMNSFPLFARGGYPILMQPYTERMTSTPLDNVIVRYYPGKTGQTESTSLYEDDGETRDYLQGGYSTTQVTTSQDSQQLTVKIVPQKSRDIIAPSWPSFRPMTRTYEIQFMASKQVQSAEVNGTAASVTFDPKLGVNHILLPLTPSDQLVTVTIGLPAGSL